MADNKNSVGGVSMEIELICDTEKQTSKIMNDAANGLQKKSNIINKAVSSVFDRAFRQKKDVDSNAKSAIKSATGSGGNSASKLIKDATGEGALLEDKLDILNQKAAKLREQLADLEGTAKIETKDGKSAFTPGEMSELQDDILKTKSSLNSTEASIEQTRKKLAKLGNSGEESFKKINTSVAGSKGVIKDLSNSAGKTLNKITGSAAKMGKRIKNIFLSAFIFSALYAGFKTLKDKMAAVLDGNKEFKKSLNDVKVNLAAAFAPIVSAVMPMLQKLMQFLAEASKQFAAFVSGIFGKTYSESAAAAKKLDDMSKAKKNLQTTGIDEMNILSKNEEETTDYSAVSDEGTESANNAGEKVKSAVSSIAESVKKKLGEAKTYITEKFAPSFDSIQKCAEKIKTPIANAFSTVKEGVLKASEKLSPFKDYVLNEFVPGVVNSFNENLLPVFSDLFGLAIEEAANDFAWFGEQAATVISGLQPAFDTVSTIWNDVCTTISETWDKYGAGLMEKFQTFKEGIREIWERIYSKIIKPIWDKIVLAVSNFWEKTGKPLFEKLCNFFAKLAGFIMDIWNNVLKPIVDWLIDFLAPIISNVVDSILAVVDTVWTTICGIIDGILTALDGVIDFITGVFTGDWEKAWTGIKNFFKGIWDAIWSVLKGVINLIIDGLNSLWSAIYSVFSAIANGLGDAISWIGDLLGFDDWGWSLPSEPPLIPKLARGGIVEQPTLALMGEAGKEAVIPLENNTAGLDRLAEMIAERGNNSNAPSRIVVQLMLDGRMIKQVVVDAINGEIMQTGESPIIAT